jgi:hypothetical protein
LTLVTAGRTRNLSGKIINFDGTQVKGSVCQMKKSLPLRWPIITKTSKYYLGNVPRLMKQFPTSSTQPTRSYRPKYLVTGKTLDFRALGGQNQQRYVTATKILVPRKTLRPLPPRKNTPNFPTGFNSSAKKKD